MRRATEQDAGVVARVLAAAFHDYPWTRWTVDATDHLARIEALQRMAFTELVLPFGEAWVTADGDEIVSAAMWMRPDTPIPEALWPALEPRVARLEGDRHAASREAEVQLAPYRPTAPHYMLGAVGTLPLHQRRGFGGAVLEPVLARVEADAAVAFLETCGADNVAFYAALGFEVVAEIALASGGPTVWAMSKDA